VETRATETRRVVSLAARPRERARALTAARQFSFEERNFTEDRLPLYNIAKYAGNEGVTFLRALAGTPNKLGESSRVSPFRRLPTSALRRISFNGFAARETSHFAPLRKFRRPSAFVVCVIRVECSSTGVNVLVNKTVCT